MFLDEATITVRGGNGGNGCVSWRREKYEPMGGPSGGDGGNGGAVWIVANGNTDTLSTFASRKKFAAPSGEAGGGSQCGGKGGEDLRLLVPPGTLIYEQGPEGKGECIADLSINGDCVCIAKGGRGGYGNSHFKSSTRQAPDFAELGEPGEEMIITLELKLVADIGIIGYPNVGKSTLISVISAAKPKIADYAFTTLTPNLGVVDVRGRNFVVCDIPGLIEGASEGKGLGHAFLRHIERCGALLHLLDISRALEPDGSVNPQKLIDDYRIIRKELEAYSPTLAAKREVVALSKVDLTMESLDPVVRVLKKEGIRIEHCISAAANQGLEQLLLSLLPLALEERALRIQTVEASSDAPLPVLQPHTGTIRMGAYRIERDAEGAIIVHGKRLEQFTVMTNFHSEGSVERFRDVLDRIGLRRELQRLRGDLKIPVRFGDISVDAYL
ncbi:MAG: GTP-binding protein [Candidatus Peregrinibacteria bacterium Greene0416_62]|nr:MAG: GTP-binding protein [Candidatus Peregrinibacteria bacterium Greene0416_62]TSC99877.1 MAG: GTP-binding protein [Candidatus Peregrinibacteria bacterium Greene1014_49]